MIDEEQERRLDGFKKTLATIEKAKKIDKLREAYPENKEATVRKIEKLAEVTS